MEELIQLHSKIDKSFNIYILGNQDKLYKKFLPLFKHYGMAYMDSKSKLIIIDGEELQEYSYNVNDMLHIIIAHEIAHFKLKHKAIIDPIQEIEADILAIHLCRKNGYKKSANIGIEEFKERHGITYEEALAKMN